MTGVYPPPTDLLREAQPFRSLVDLPNQIKSKITLVTAEGTAGSDECDCCWHWTGSFRVARQRYRTYRVHEDFNGLRQSNGCFESERGEPRVKIPKWKNAVPAYRAVFALAAGIEFDAVPQLSRCANDRCVSPHHVVEKGPSPAAVRTRKAIAEAGGVQPVSVLPVDMLAFLKQRRPYGGAGIEGMEEETGLPPGSISKAVALEYQAWDEATSEPDDD